jgi:hypothetical protein
MNRKRRRETIRKIQSEELSLKVVHPHAAGNDIGNESRYVAVPPSRDSQPVRCFGCTTAELKAMADWLKQCGIRTTGGTGPGLPVCSQAVPQLPYSALVRAPDHLPCRFVSLSQNFTRQKQVSEKSAEMDGSIQIVDQLGTDYGLGQNELNGSQRIVSIAIKNG